MWSFLFSLCIFYLLFYELHLFISLNCVLSEFLISICNLLIFSSALLFCFIQTLRLLKNYVFHKQNLNFPLFRNFHYLSKIFFSCFFFFFLFTFSGHTCSIWKFPRLGVESELQLLVYATTTTAPDPSCVLTYTTAHSNAGSLTH